MRKTMMIILGFIFLVVLMACTEDTTKFTVTFDTKGGNPSIESQTVESGTLVVKPIEITREDYIFKGWFSDEELTQEWVFETHKVLENITLYAKWELDEKVNVSFDVKGGSPIASIKVSKGSLFNAPVTPTKEGLEFGGWYKDTNYAKAWNFTFDKAESDITLVARWKELNDYSKSLKVLSIGNSFSEDAHRYLWSIAQSYGVDPSKIVIANMYIGGAELVQHVQNSGSNAKVYQYQLFKGPDKVTTSNVSLGEAIAKEYWDVITFQQASHHSGLSDTYKEHLNSLVAWADALAVNPNVKIGWHMTWAYQQTSNHSGFVSYDRSQSKMYEMIVETTKQKVLTNTQVNIVIPSGTAIQNARTSYIGDTLTNDGYHLTDPMGRYIAGLMFFKSITGFEVSPSKINFRPNGVSEQDQIMAMESVNNAFMKPYEVVKSIYNETPEPEPIEIEGINYEFEYVQGFWNTNATAISPETDGLHKNFAGVMPRPKAMLPVGSEIVIEKGYQYRTIFFEKQGDTFKVVHRTDNSQVPYVKVDEAFWGTYQYVGFNISSVPTTDITQRLDEVASKLKLYHPEGTGEGHIDLELTYSLGEWIVDEVEVAESNLIIVTNPLTPNFFTTNHIASVKEGYKFALVELIYDNGYKVISVSDFTYESLLLDLEFKANKELVAFMIKANDGRDLSTEEISKIMTIAPSEVPHIDYELTFKQGYWADNATSILTEDIAFNKRFIASNVLSKTALIGATSLTISSDYQVRVIFLTYDNYGNYKVIKRTDNFKGNVLMDEAFWGTYQYVAFNLSNIDNASDISGIIDTVSDSLKFQYTLNYISGYWNSNATSITTTDTTAKSYIASNILGRNLIPAGSIIKLETGYQARVIFLSSIDGVNFKVENRSENMTGEFALTNALYKDYKYIAFNISKVPISDITQEVDVVKTKLSIKDFEDEIIEHEDQPLTFVSGYWNDKAVKVTPGTDTFSKGFAASNVISLESLSDYTSVTIQEGYQVRIVFFDYSYNTYTVLFRTANLTGTIVLDEQLLLNYEFVAFNISTVPSSDLSESLTGLENKIIFN